MADSWVDLGGVGLVALSALLLVALSALWLYAFLRMRLGAWFGALRGLSAVMLGAALAGVWLSGSQIRGVGLVVTAAGAFFWLVQAIARQPRRQTVQAGEPVRSFVATAASGASFDLASLEGKPFLLKFYRGHWCPYCRQELTAWHEMEHELEQRGITFLAISPDTADETAAFAAQRPEYRMTWLSDADLRVTDLYNLRSHTTLAVAKGRAKRRPLAVPTTILVDARGIVRWVDQSADHQVRSDPRLVLPAIDAALHVHPTPPQPMRHHGSSANGPESIRQAPPEFDRPARAPQL